MRRWRESRKKRAWKKIKIIYFRRENYQWGIVSEMTCVEDVKQRSLFLFLSWHQKHLACLLMILQNLYSKKPKSKMKGSAREQQGQAGPAMVTGVSQQPSDKAGPKSTGESDVQSLNQQGAWPGTAALQLRKTPKATVQPWNHLLSKGGQGPTGASQGHAAVLYQSWPWAPSSQTSMGGRGCTPGPDKAAFLNDILK